MDAFFESIWRLVVNTASLVLVIWLMTAAIKSLFKGGK